VGFFWDLLQQSELNAQARRAGTLEERVTELERDLRETRELLHRLVKRLEEGLGEDLNRDGRVG
jgi:uncharacterized protein involved in exopolysaccharide biosynthesis